MEGWKTRELNLFCSEHLPRRTMCQSQMQSQSVLSRMQLLNIRDSIDKLKVFRELSIRPEHGLGFPSIAVASVPDTTGQSHALAMPVLRLARSAIEAQ